MPRPPKLVFNKAVLSVTTSLEEGLLLIPNPLMHVILQSALACAQSQHPLKIVDFTVEGTHIHFVVVIDNPDDFKGFMCRFKTETAHAINKLLGRKKRTVWCRGSDSPIALTEHDVVERVVYTLINPVKDGLVETVNEYPGLNSLKLEKKGSVRTWYRLRRWMIPTINPKSMSYEDCQRLAKRLVCASKEPLKFRIDRDAWMNSFDITDVEERREWRGKIRSRVAEEEANYREERIKAGKGVVGRERLMRGEFDLHYMPERSGRRMWVICHDRAQRREFIEFLKALIYEGREVYLRWRQGDYAAAYPVGLYPPSLPKNAELMGSYVFD